MADSQSYPKRGDPEYAAFRRARNEIQRAYRRTLPVERRRKLTERSREYQSAYRLAHTERKAAIDHAYREANKERLALRRKKYYAANKERLLARNKERYKANKKARTAWQKKYSAANKERIAAYHKIHYQKPDVRERRSAYTRRRMRERYFTDPQLRIVLRLRARVRNVLRLYLETRKARPTMRLIGCSPAELVAYIEARLSPGMSWDNYGRPSSERRVWNIDHIRPCASFDLSDAEQQLACFHFTNLQPLWWVDNHAKGARILL